MHQLDQLAADRKPQARAAELARDAAVGLFEGFEDALLLVQGDTHARIGHREFERRLGAVDGHQGHRQQYGAGSR